MTAASCSMSPSAVSTAPRPALKCSSFSRTATASTTASTALPPADSALRPASTARARPSFSAGARSGRMTPPPAPPWTTTIGPETGIASDMRISVGRRSGGAPDPGTSRRRGRRPGGGRRAAAPPSARAVAAPARAAAGRARARTGGHGVPRTPRSARAPRPASPALDDRPQLAPTRDPEVERRPDPLARQREAVPGGVADEEHAVARRPGAGDAGTSCPGSGPARGPLAPRAPPWRRGRAAVARRTPRRPGPPCPPARTSRSRGGRGAIDPHVELVGVDRVVGMHLQTARERCVGRLEDTGGAEDAPPAQRVHDERRAQHAAVRRDAAVDAALHERGLEARVGLRAQKTAQLAVVERGPAPRQAAADEPCGVVKRMHGSSLRIAAATPIAWSQSVGAAQALVACSPIS